jgi:predicted AAA+ superfamily ATPase
MRVDPAALLLYREVARSQLALDVVRVEETSGSGANALYADVFARLAGLEGNWADPWRHFVRRAVVVTETPFSVAARTSGRLSDGLAAAMRHDLALLQRLHDIDGDAVARRLSEDGGDLPSWTALGTRTESEGPERTLVSAADWTTLVEALWEHFRAHSAGPVGEYRAFRYGAGGLQPIAEPDPVRLSDLIGYEQQQRALVDNTAILAAGHRANNALLYGPRGTGKSSTVKALVNEFAACGVRLFQIDKTDLALFAEAVHIARHRPEKFVFFIDDLSYELGETDYGHLKGLLEGGLELRPDNVVIYATSNRRHLVDERFGDRDDAGDPVHIGDLHQHKLSLSDRFGVRQAFPAVDQPGYLAIVRGLAAGRGLGVTEELEAEAIRWSIRHNGLSPRSAQHFVDHVSGRAALGGR